MLTLANLLLIGSFLTLAFILATRKVIERNEPGICRDHRLCRGSLFYAARLPVLTLSALAQEDC
jgi:hypothetical protein